MTLMTDPDPRPITGGCLCGALRYAAAAPPLFAGFCYCADCRKASGAACIPFMGFAAAALEVSGATRAFRSPALRGGEAVRNFCAVCGGLVFGGVLGQDAVHTVYAGSLDDPSRFAPSQAVFVRDRPAWAPLPRGLTPFDTLPPED